MDAMDTGLVVDHGQPTWLAPAAQKFKRYAESASSENTRRGYKACWASFSSWCEARSLPSLPTNPDVVGLFLSDQADCLKVSSLKRRIAAIKKAHVLAGYSLDARSPAIRDILRGICREKSVAVTRKSPMLIDDLRHIVDVIPNTLTGKRDKALLLMGFAGAFRRSELANLLIEDIEIQPRGLLIHIRRSKTDQEGKGAIKGISYGRNPHTCPIKAYLDWIEAAGITTGYIFRRFHKGESIGVGLKNRSVALIIKKWIGEIGMDNDKFAGHSLRSGFVTSAIRVGKSLLDVMSQTGHKSEQMLKVYYRKENIFHNNASDGIGL